jgi:hypothetical protein
LPIGLARPDGVVIFTSLRKANSCYYAGPLFINFSVSTAKKGYTGRHGPGSGNLRESPVKATISHRQYLLSRIALRLLKIIEPYLVEQNRMANAQLL